MKEQYMEDLKDYLEDSDINEILILDVMSDYDEFYDEYILQGLTHEEIVKKLGTPRMVFNSIRSTLEEQKTVTTRNKIVSLTPFISLIVFFVVGYTTKVWHPTWLIFFLVPVTSIVLHGKGFLETFRNLSVFISIIAYILLGYFLGIWVPTMTVFLIVPLSGIFMYNKSNLLDKIINTVTLLLLGVIFLFTYYQIMDIRYSWLFLFIYPIANIFRNNNIEGIINQVSLFLIILLSITGYSILILNNVNTYLALLTFLLPLAALIYMKRDLVTITYTNRGDKKGIAMLVITIISILAFVVLGIVFKSWAYIWQVLLIIPMASTIIYNPNKRFRFVAIAPFISIILFFSFGYFLDVWALSWLFFLLIPIAGVLDN